MGNREERRQERHERSERESGDPEAVELLRHYKRAYEGNQDYIEGMRAEVRGSIDVSHVIGAAIYVHTGGADKKVDDVVDTLTRRVLTAESCLEYLRRHIGLKASMNNETHRPSHTRLLRFMVPPEVASRAAVLLERGEVGYGTQD